MIRLIYEPDVIERILCAILVYGGRTRRPLPDKPKTPFPGICRNIQGRVATQMQAGTKPGSTTDRMESVADAQFILA